MNDKGQLGNGYLSDDPSPVASLVLEPAEPVPQRGPAVAQWAPRGVWSATHTDDPLPTPCSFVLEESPTARGR